MCSCLNIRKYDWHWSQSLSIFFSTFRKRKKERKNDIKEPEDYLWRRMVNAKSAVWRWEILIQKGTWSCMMAQGPLDPVCVGNCLPIRVHYYAMKKLAALARFLMYNGFWAFSRPPLEIFRSNLDWSQRKW